MTPAELLWLERMWADHHAHIRRYLTVRTRDWALAEDLTSETFLRALLAASRYTDNNPEAWLQRIAQRIHLDHIKSARSKYEISHDTFLDEGPAALDPAVIVEHDTDLGLLLQAVESLKSSKRRRCLALDLADATTSEACADLGTNPGALKVLRHRAINELRTIMGVAA